MSDPVAEGINAENVTAWFGEHVPAAVAPLQFELIAGGHSNLTYRVIDSAGESFVLRRPPLGHVLATAHDMAREHTIISAVGTTDVPVPETLGLDALDAVLDDLDAAEIAIAFPSFRHEDSP